MKVFIAASWYPTPKKPSAVPFISEQAVALAEKGCDVTVLSVELVSLKSGEKAGFTKKTLHNVKIYQIILPVYRFGSKELSAKLTTVLMKYLFDKAVREQGKPDIVHIHSFRFAGCAASQKAKEYGVPCVLTEHYSSINTNTLTEVEKKYLALTRADKVISVSDALAEKLREHGMESVVINNFVDEEMFTNSPIDHADFTFVSCGRLTEQKGFDILLKAFAKLNDCKLKIIGSGPYLGTLKELAEELQITDRVQLIPALAHEKLNDEFNSSDCFVLPSRGETFGVVYIEAMACGLPVIGTKCGGPEKIINDKNGILVDIDDVDGLADAMRNFLNKKVVLSSSEVRRECIEKYGKSNIIEKIISIYKDLLK